MDKTRTVNIGLVVANIEDDFSNAVCAGAIRAATQMKNNLFIFPAKYLDRSDLSTEDPKQRYEYQYNILLSYASSQSLDILLICLSSIGYMSTKETCRKVLEQYKGIPVMLIASEEEGYSSVTYNNTMGLEAGISYLIKQQHCRHICMLNGFLSNKDAYEREQVYQNTMKKYQMEPDRLQIAHAEFSENCLTAMEELLHDNEKMDGLICGNDAMARTAYRVLKNRGFEIGKDIKVIGFDDIEEAKHFEPPLATVRADAGTLGFEGVMKANQMLSGIGEKKAVDFKVETSFVLRQSAGEKENQNTQNYQVNYKTKYESVIDMNHSMNIANRDMLMFGNSIRENYARFLSAFTTDQIREYYMYLLYEPFTYERNSIWHHADGLYLKAYRHDDKAVNVAREHQRVLWDELFSNHYYKKEPSAYVVIDIYSRKKQYGILVCDLPYDYFHYAEMLCYQISIAMKMRDLLITQEVLLREKEEMLTRLEEENLILDDISNKDELTGILNRRGIIKGLNDLFKSGAVNNHSMAIFYLDLNYLKKINDTFSHEEGNFAICTCARVMEQILGDNSIIGRIGGDEFVGAVMTSKKGEGQQLLKQMKNYFRHFNETSGKSYRVMASIGVYEFIYNKKMQIKDLLDHADELLYEDKNRKEPFMLQ